MGKGWEKENYPNILGRKYIDKSILKYGTVIPLKLINNFLDNVSGKLVQRGGIEKYKSNYRWTKI